MKTKNLWLAVAACLLLVAVYVAGYKTGYRPGYKEGYKVGENSAESKLREKELAFQKEKEETRKAEYAEEKRAEEHRRKVEAYKEVLKQLAEAEEKDTDRMMALVLQYTQLRSAGNRLPEPVFSPEVISSIPSLNTVVKARITSDFDGLKDGNIYKLDNGQIWEQTDFYIHTRIAITPSVIIWRDGVVYKMIVDGIDKAVTVRQLE